MFQTVRKTVLMGLLAVSLIAALALPITSAFAASGQPLAGNPDPSRLDIAGSTTVYPVVQVSITRFPNSASGAVLNVAQGGSGAGKTGILNGTLDIGMSSSGCKAGTDDVGKTYTCGQLVDTVFARDAVSIIINVNAPCALTQLTKADLSKIWGDGTAGYTNWNQIPGCSANQPLHIFAREVGSGTRQSLLDLVGAPLTDANEQAKITASGTRKNGSPAMEAGVDGDPLSIGYAGLHFVGGNNRAVPINFSGTAVAPSDTTVANNTYPMSRNLHLYTLPTTINSKALIQTYLSWILQPEAQAIVLDMGYLNVGPMARPADVNLDGIVDISDVVVIGNNWSATNAVLGWIRSDVNYDGIVDISDVVVVGNFWGATGNQ